MNNLTCDLITIDTNVFEGLLNPEINIDDHIGILLHTLQQDDISLLVDNECRIANQYENRLGERIRKGAMEQRGEMYLLMYWFNYASKRKITTNHNDELMIIIKKTLSGVQDTTDWIFVYVALKSKRVLVTNDRKELINGGENPTEYRRHKLIKIIERRRLNGAAIMISKEACQKLN